MIIYVISLTHVNISKHIALSANLLLLVLLGKFLFPFLKLLDYFH